MENTNQSVTMKLHIVLLFILASSIAVNYAQEQAPSHGSTDQNQPKMLTKQDILRGLWKLSHQENIDWDDGLKNQAQSVSCTDKPTPPLRKFLLQESESAADPEVEKGFKSGKLKFVGCALRLDCNPPDYLCLANPSSSGSSSGPPTDPTTTVANFSSSTRLFSIGLFVILAVIYL